MGHQKHLFAQIPPSWGQIKFLFTILYISKIILKHFCDFFLIIIFFFVSDKNPALNEFVSQIKATAELQPLFDMIQKDCSGSNLNEAHVMDQS